MIKQKKLQRLLLLFLLPFFFYNCNDDHEVIPIENNNTEDLKSAFLNLESLKSINSNAAHKLQSIGETNNNLQSRGGNTTLALDTNTILELHTEFYNSYTVPLISEETSPDTITNYVLTSYPNGDFLQHLVFYYYDKDGFIDHSKTKVKPFEGGLLLNRGNTCTTISDVKSIDCKTTYCDTKGHEYGDEIGKSCTGSFDSPTGSDCTVSYINEEDCSSSGGSGGSSGHGNNTTGGTGNTSGHTSGDNSGTSGGGASLSVTAPLTSAYNDRKFTDFLRELGPLQQLWMGANRAVANEFGNLYIESGYSQEVKTLINKTTSIFMNEGTVADLTSEYEINTFIDLVSLYLVGTNSGRYNEFKPILLAIKHLDLNFLERLEVNGQLAELARLVFQAKNTTDIIRLKEFNKEIHKKENAMSIFSFLQELKQYWPRNADEWKVLGQLFAGVAGEVLVSLIPFSDVIDLFRGFQDGSTFTIALAIGGLIVDLVGGGFIKGFIETGKIGVKLARAWRKIVNFRDTLTNVIKKGFRVKTNRANGALELVNDAGEVIVRGADEVEIFTKTSKRLDDLGLDDTLRKDPDIIKAFQKIDCN